MYQIFRAVRLMSNFTKPIRMCAPMITANNYLHIYNLNQYYQRLLEETPEEDEEVMQVNIEREMCRPKLII